MTEENDQRARNVRRGFVSAAVVGGVAVVLFVAAILLDLGRLAGVGGVLLGVAVVIVIATFVYDDWS